MIGEQQGGQRGVLGRVKVWIGLEGLSDIAVEVANFTRDFSNELRLIGWEMSKRLCAFSVLDLSWCIRVRFENSETCTCCRIRGIYTSFKPKSPYMLAPREEWVG